MTRDQMCIKELYEILDKVTENATKHDLSLVNGNNGACGSDAYQGSPPLCRMRDEILDKYGDVINNSFRAFECKEVL